MDISQLLRGVQSADSTVRNNAEQQLKQLENSSLVGYINSLTAVLIEERNDPALRALAGIVLKNCFNMNGINGPQKAYEWKMLDGNIRNSIKVAILQTFDSDGAAVRNAAAQVCGKIAAIELPYKEWPTLIDTLLSNMSKTRVQPRIATVQALGYICADIDPVAVQGQSNQILTAVIRGMVDPNDEVRLYAAKALQNALGFVSANFQVEIERNYIMQVVLEACQLPNPEVSCVALECLLSIASLYYVFLPTYMQNIFSCTLEIIKRGHEPTAMLAIEFWSTICDEELELIEGDTAQPCHNFIAAAAPHVVPVILETLSKQEEFADEDVWDLSQAGATCLSLIANVVQDNIVGLVVPFVQKHLHSTNWHFQEAAAMAFGSILEGPTGDISILAHQILEPLLVLLTKQNGEDIVRETVVWTIGRICEFHPQAIRGAFDKVLKALTSCLKDTPRIAANSCWALAHMATSFTKSDFPLAGSFSPHFQTVVMSLLVTTDRTDTKEANLRISAFEAVSAMLCNAPPDCATVVGQLMPDITRRLNTCCIATVRGVDQKEAQAELQGLLCGLVFSAISNLHSSKTRYYVVPLLESMVQVLNSENTSAHEDALLVVGVLARVDASIFVRFLSKLMPSIFRALREIEETSKCSVAIGVVTDIANVARSSILPHCDEIITILLMNLRSAALGEIKTKIIACFGDIAMATRDYFVRYITTVVPIIEQAASMEVKPDSDTYFLNQMQDATLVAYTGILHCLLEAKQGDMFAPHAHNLLVFLHKMFQSTNDESVLKTCVGLAGDLVTALGPKIKPMLPTQFLVAMTDECLKSENENIRKAGAWLTSALALL